MPTGLDILAKAAEQVSKLNEISPVQSNEVKATAQAAENFSPILQEMESTKTKPKRLLDSLPDRLTSESSIRKMAIANLKIGKEKAQKEIKEKARYLALKRKESVRRQLALKPKQSKLKERKPLSHISVIAKLSL